MKKILLLFLPLVAADLYKETQDFQYRRTADDDEQKGYYSSQSGNMGGNYELSHNMDHLAHNQMKGLMHQVGSQLDIDPSAIGTGKTLSQANKGTLYGSASASGSSYGSTLGNNYRRTGLGSDTYTSRQSGRNVQNSNDERLRGISQTNYDAGRSHYYDSKNQHGEKEGYSSDIQNGRLYTASTNGVRESGKTSHYASNAEASDYEAESVNDNQRRVVEVRPGSTVRLVVRPGQAIPLSIPVQSQSRSVISSSDYERRQHDVQEGSAVDSQLPAVRLVPVSVPVNTYRGAAHTYQQRGQNYGSSSNYYNEDRNSDRIGASDTQQLVKAEPLNENIGQASRQYESSYSSQKHQESRSSSRQQPTYSQGRPLLPTSLSGQVTDLGTAAQNRDKFVVGVLGVEGEGQGSTTYNSGSRVASTGRHYANNQEKLSSGYANNMQSARNSDGYEASRLRNLQSSGLNYQAANAYDQDRTLEVDAETKPKSFHSSYSYHKSWEKHGDPYMILPDGSTRVITDEVEKEKARNFLSQQESVNRQTGGSSHYAENTDVQSTDLERLKQRMQSQMSNMCTDCNNAKTKGYQASYSYSAQRQYGNHDQAGVADNRRFKRSTGLDMDAEDLGQIARSVDPNVEDMGQRLINHGNYNRFHSEYSDHSQLRGQLGDTGDRSMQQPSRGYLYQQKDLGQQTEDIDRQIANLNTLRVTQTQRGLASSNKLNEDYGQQTEKRGQESFNFYDRTNEDHSSRRDSYFNDRNENQEWKPKPLSLTADNAGSSNREKSFLDLYYPNRDITTTTPKNHYQEEDLGQKVEKDVQQIQQISQSQINNQNYQQQSSRSIYSESIGEEDVKKAKGVIILEIPTTTQKPGFWTRTKDKVKSWFD